MERLSWIFTVSTVYNHMHPHIREAEDDFTQERRKKSENGGRDISVKTTNQGMPGSTKS